MSYTLKRDEEEAVFRKKLLFDGHGAGEDKRLVSLLKNLTKFSLAELNSEELTKTYSTIMKEISAAIGAAERQSKVSEMWDRTFNALEQAIKEKSAQIEVYKSRLDSLQLDLEYAEKLKKVNVYPDCQSIEQTMREIESKRCNLVEKIEQQKSHSNILLEACKSLQQIIDD